MQETPPVLRRNINKVIEISVLIGFMVLIGVLAMQPIHLSQTATKKVSGTLRAGINQHFGEVLKGETAKNARVTTSLTSGINRHFDEVLKEKSKEVIETKKAQVEKLEVEIVTAPEKTIETAEVVKETETKETEEAAEAEEKVEDAEPEMLYKSLDEVKISRDMDLTQTTGLSKEDFRDLLADFKYDYAGFYKQNAGLIWELSQKYQVNEIFLCGVFALESYFGSDDRHVNAHNYGSIMNKYGELVRYASDAEGIEANFKLFANCYLSTKGKYYKGVNIDSIGDTYCPPTPECPSWADKVYCCMQYFLE